MKVKYQVFISSTFEDLKEIREQVIRCVLEMGHIPVGMEMFSAANDDQWRVIQRQIDDCDYYIVIIAHRYGSLDKDISYTEKEYDYAVTKDIPVLGFVIDDSAKWSTKFIDSDPIAKQRIDKFKEKIKSRMVSFWKNTDDIYGKFAVSFGKAISTYERPGYVRASEVANIDVYNEVTRLSNENAKLRSNIENNTYLEKKEEENKELELISILETTKRIIPVKFKGETDWNRDYELSYLDLFETIGQRLLIESSEIELKKAIALTATGMTNYNPTVPVPGNRFVEWISDLNALNLIKESEKKHEVSDSNRYWTLTSYGDELFRKLRRLKLLKGISSNEEVQDTDENQEKNG